MSKLSNSAGVESLDAGTTAQARSAVGATVQIIMDALEHSCQESFVLPCFRFGGVPGFSKKLSVVADFREICPAPECSLSRCPHRLSRQN